MHDASTGCGDLRMQLLHAVLKRLRALGSERIINAVVHAVAGEHKLRVRLLQHAIQTLMQVRSRKLAARMPVLAQSTHRLAAQTERNDFLRHLGMLRDQRRLNDLDVTSTLRDAVAEEGDALFFGEFCRNSGHSEEEGENEMTHENEIRRRQVRAAARRCQ